MKTLKLESGKITLVPTKEGLGVYKDKSKILEMNLADAQSLMICFLDFARIMTPPVEVKGRKLPKTSKHRKQRN